MIGVESNLFSNNIIDQGRHAAAAPPSASLALLCLTVARPAPLYCTVQAAQCGATVHNECPHQYRAANGGGALYVSYYLHVCLNEIWNANALSISI